MANKGKEGFIPIIILIVVLAIAVLLSLFWIRSLHPECVGKRDCIILPFGSRGGFSGVPAEIPAPKIPQPVISSVPAVNTVDCQYYNIDSIKFAWEMPPDVDGVEYGMSKNPDYEFSKTSMGVVSSTEYDLNLFGDGILYFSARFKEGKNWGPAGVKYFYLDRTSPEPFRIARENNDYTNEQPVFSWDADDKVSGIAYYRVKIGDGDWFDANTIKQDEAYVLPEQAAAYSRTLTVRAYDFAGNFRDSSANFQVIPKTGWRSFLYEWPLFLIVIVIIALAFLFFFLIYRLIKWRNRLVRKIRRDFSVKSGPSIEKTIEKFVEEIKDDGQNQ